METTVDTWLKGNVAGPIPDGAQFVAAYEIDAGIDHFAEVAFIRRLDAVDELWGAMVDGEIDASRQPHPRDIHEMRTRRVGRLAVGPAQSPLTRSACLLLATVFRSRVGFGWPGRWHLGGLVNKTDWQEVVASIERELSANAAAASDAEGEVVAVARELGLDPTPTGTGDNHWRAQCPGAKHHLQVRTRIEAFYCGYCRRGGGPDDLRVFAAERSPSKAQSVHTESKLS